MNITWPYHVVSKKMKYSKHVGLYVICGNSMINMNIMLLSRVSMHIVYHVFASWHIYRSMWLNERKDSCIQVVFNMCVYGCCFVFIIVVVLFSSWLLFCFRHGCCFIFHHQNLQWINMTNTWVNMCFLTLGWCENNHAFVIIFWMHDLYLNLMWVVAWIC